MKDEEEAGEYTRAAVRWDVDEPDATIMETYPYGGMEWEDMPGLGRPASPETLRASKARRAYLAFANDTVLVGDDLGDFGYVERPNRIWASISTGAIHFAHEADEPRVTLFAFPSLDSLRKFEEVHRTSCKCRNSFIDAYTSQYDCSVAWPVFDNGDNNQPPLVSFDLDPSMKEWGFEIPNTELARRTLDAAMQRPLLPEFTTPCESRYSDVACTRCRAGIQVNSMERLAACLPSMGCPRVGWYIWNNSGDGIVRHLCRRCWAVVKSEPQRCLLPVTCHAADEECSLCPSDPQRRYTRLSADTPLLAWMRACHAISTGDASVTIDRGLAARQPLVTTAASRATSRLMTDSNVALGV